jgi:phosphomannomutase/phosphoglucomutase
VAVVASEIFRAYDIRGIVGEDLTTRAAELVGRAFGTTVRREGGGKVLVGRDGRLSGPELSEALIAGIRASGCTVVEAGMLPTPAFYFGLHHLDLDGGIQVTGSHNPPEYNGFKVCLGTKTIFGDDIQKLRQVIEADDFEQGGGGLETADLLEPYKAMIRERINLARPLRVAVDAGNGVAGPVTPGLYRELGCEVVELYCDVDGSFPNHHPDPTLEEAVEDLQRVVVEQGLDLGLGFDGDADRVGIIDAAGEIVWGDRLLILLARDLLDRQPGAAVICDVKCSQVVMSDIAQRGGRPIMWKTGHSLIKQKMREEGAQLAGEMSGHLFFGENFFGHDDAIYAGAKLLEILSLSEGAFADLLADLPPSHTTPEIRHDSTEAAKFEICERLRDELAAELEVLDIDGVRANYEGGWGLARPSNTQPAIVLRFEADSAERLAEIQADLMGRLHRIEHELGIS